MTEFADNNTIFSNIDMNFFFVNKDFNSRMFFNSDNIENIITREKLESVKVENISEIMQCVLKYMQQQFHKACEIMIKQINKRKKKINYEIEDKIFLFSRKVITDRPFKKLEDKTLNSFLITEQIEIFYRFQLSKFIKLYEIFYSYLLRKDLNDSLFELIQEPLSFIITKENEKYELNDIKNFR